MAPPHISKQDDPVKTSERHKSNSYIAQHASTSSSSPSESSSRKSPSGSPRHPRFKRSSSSQRDSATSSRVLSKTRNQKEPTKESASSRRKAVKLGKHIQTVIESAEEPAKKLGNFVLWASPLIFAGLEIKHEFHSHGHKRKLMKQELEKGRLDLQQEIDKRKMKELQEGGEKSGQPEEMKELSEARTSRQAQLPDSRSEDEMVRLKRAASSMGDLELPNHQGSFEIVRHYRRRRSPWRRVRFLSRSQSRSSVKSTYESYYRRRVRRRR